MASSRAWRGCYGPSTADGRSSAGTPGDIMASPDSVGTPLAAADTTFGQRDLIKLAFAETGTVVAEQAGPHGAGNPQALGELPVLATPVAGNATVRAIDVSGQIQLTSSGPDGRSEDDYYSFSGKKGDIVTFSVMSRALSRSARRSAERPCRFLEECRRLSQQYPGQLPEWGGTLKAVQLAIASFCLLISGSVIPLVRKVLSSFIGSVKKGIRSAI